jgi:hypothetical protein
MGWFLATHHVLIELRRNLTLKAEYNRLVGQINDMMPGKHNIVVVLCGETSADLLDRLKATYRPSIFPEPNIALFAKHQTRLNSSGRLVFSPLAIFSMFAREIFLSPRSTPE